MNSFAARLLSWFDDHGRKDLPWQRSGDPYGTWVSEVMLQQTQVQTVIPYFNRFMASFPDIAALAEADLDEVLSHWSGLGYYARARNLHRAAKCVVDEHAGAFPRDLESVMALPGVGRSTAGAILAQAFGERAAILDGNAKRVLARHAGIEGWPGRSAVARSLWATAESNTPHERVADYTQAIMDLGAALCSRSRPDCERCPVSADCAARAQDAVDRYPGRKPRAPRSLRATTMLLLVRAGGVYLVRRPEAGIWGGLWSLPELGDEDVEAWCRQRLGAGIDESFALPELRHSFSHFDLDIRPLLVRVAAPLSKVADSEDGVWHSLGEPLPGGVAAPVKRLIEDITAHVTE